MLNLLELNEFNFEYLIKVSEKYDFRNIKLLTKLNITNTYTLDNQEHKNLDPWVQWVSIHTGKKSDDHNIFELGEAKYLKYEQIWDKLYSIGIKSGIFGAMNTKYNKVTPPSFYLPDPWNISQESNINDLNDFLALPRYYASEYSSPKITKLILKSLSLLKFSIKNLDIFLNPTFLKNIFLIIKNIKFSSISLFLILDYISTRVFLKYKKKYKTSFNILFLNSIAHFQHHKWLEVENKKTKFFFYIIDEILRSFLKNDEDIIIMNGFTQKKIKKGSYYIFRHKNIEKILDIIEVKPKEISQNMTNECYLSFENTFLLNDALNKIINLQIDERKFFSASIEKDNKLFLKVAIHQKPKDRFIISKKFNYQIDLYKNYILTERTGSHSSEGIVISNKSLEKKIIQNHEIFDFILKYFYDSK